MPRAKLPLYMQQLFLYVVNVYQPCTASEMLAAVQSASIPALKQMDSSDLQDVLDRCEKDQYLLKTAEGSYYLTYRGLRFVSQLGLAFTRDKNRLFYLKQALGKPRDRS